MSSPLGVILLEINPPEDTVIYPRVKGTAGINLKATNEALGVPAANAVVSPTSPSDVVLTAMLVMGFKVPLSLVQKGLRLELSALKLH